ncbi:MAG: hypothetical protein KF869_15625, partial [Phycisphaeraceae bacterium]|nr:hypothetical protein [Phycisphaeraceae bacterium]
MPSSASTSWPADRFYWSILDLPPGAARRIRTGPLPSGLRPMFEEDVPETESALADLHAVCAPIDGNRLLVCAVPRSALAELPVDALALTPDASDLASFIRGEHNGEHGSEHGGEHALAQLNLLVGAHEPLVFRRARARRTSLALITIALCAALASFGLHQRTALDHSLATDHSRSAHELAASLGRGITPADLPALVGRARQSAAAAANITEPADAAAPLAALLAAWPTAHASSVQSINAAGEVISITLTIEGD